MGVTKMSIPKGLHLSPIGFGTWGIGGEAYVGGRPVGAKGLSEEDALGVLSAAVERGITTFDVSPGYGVSEVLVGKLLKRFRHERLCIAAKIGFEPGKELHFTAEGVKRSLDATFSRLGQEYVDVLQFRTPMEHPMPVISVLSLLQPYVNKGNVGAIGVSLHNAAEGMMLLAHPEVVCFQVQYNLFDTRAFPFLGAAKQAGRCVIVKSPLNKGFLSSSITAQRVFDPEDLRSRVVTVDILSKRLAWIDGFLREFALPRERLLAAAVHFLRAHADIDSVLYGFRSNEHMNEMCALYEEPLLDAATLRRMQAYSEEHRRDLDSYFW